jgi:adenylate cyclase
MAYLLIVEDDVDSREPLCRMLESVGHEVACTSNGQEALASILARRPDLIILDLFMPEMDGPSLLEILRSYLRLQSLPVIVLTGAPDSPQVERVRHLKVNAILTKAKATHDEILHEVAQQLPRLPG